MKLLKKLLGIEPPQQVLENEVLVSTPVGCEHCGSGVLRVLRAEQRLRCKQCFALDLPLTPEQIERFTRDHAWVPAQSSRHDW